MNTSEMSISEVRSLTSKSGSLKSFSAIEAEMIEDLYARKAGLVVWNVLMPEADRQGGDRDLAAMLKHYPVVLSSVPYEGPTKNKPRKPGTAVINSEYMNQIVAYNGLIANIPALENSAVGVGR